MATYPRWNEMLNAHLERTKKHISLVNKYGRIYNNRVDNPFPGHDADKLTTLLSPYVMITARYLPEFKDTEWDEADIEYMTLATKMHVLTNFHHPEMWSGLNITDDFISKANRDKPVKQPSNEEIDVIVACPLCNGKLAQYTERPPKPFIITPATMSGDSLLEMCCDWAAVAEERGGTPLKWFESNQGVRWQFSDEQEGMIRSILDYIWR